MLKDVIEYVRSRTGLDRASALREINFAWKELYNTDDFPNSLEEISVKPIDDSARISLPWYVGNLRAVKYNLLRNRVILNTPRRYYQDDQYFQSIFTWRVLFTTPLLTTITNASTITISVELAETSDIVVTLIGPTDTGSEDKEQITLEAGQTSVVSTKRFMDLVQVSKDIITTSDIVLYDANDQEISRIPNSQYEAHNTVVQVVDKCWQPNITYNCWDILYKRTVRVLYFDETPLPIQEEVLMSKTMEWIEMAKDGGSDKAALFSGKAGALLAQVNTNAQSTEKYLDLADSEFATRYPWNI